MARSIINLDESAILSSDGVQKGLEDVAGAISQTANRNTSAPIGVTWRRVDEQTVHIGPRGAAAVPVEYGTRYFPARRPVKRALDAHEVH